jgi:hypothetical protein
MAQILVYGLRSHLAARRPAVSEVIHGCAVDALQLPVDKCFHRFILLDAEDFIFPAGRSEAYTIIEVHLMKGRSVQVRKHFIRLLFERFEACLGIVPADVEVCLIESDACNWGFRGLHGDEAELGYSIQV